MPSLLFVFDISAASLRLLTQNPTPHYQLLASITIYLSTSDIDSQVKYQINLLQ